ncbi:hypothetical protein GN956_G15669 [Arapaima gigas]
MPLDVTSQAPDPSGEEPPLDLSICGNSSWQTRFLSPSRSVEHKRNTRAHGHPARPAEPPTPNGREPTQNGTHF